MADLVREPPHGLYHQAFAPEELLVGSVCADGHGIGWYEAEEVARYASILPVWNDVNVRGFGAAVRSPCIVAAVRNATEADSLQEANCAPFAADGVLFSLNGFLQDFPTVWRPWFEERLESERLTQVRGTTDGEYLFQLILQEARDGLPTAVQGVLRDVRAAADELGKEAQLNILMADGERLLATRAGNQSQQNSLYHLADGRDFPGAHVVASERLDADEAWHAVPESMLVVLAQDAPPVKLKI